MKPILPLYNTMHTVLAVGMSHYVPLNYLRSFPDVVCMLVWCEVQRSELAGFVFHHAATVYAYYFISVRTTV